MTSLINKIELLIKREKTTPEKKKDDSKKSSHEILSELFSAFNADPPKIEEVPSKKKKTKKKHKKKDKKRSHRNTKSDDSDNSEISSNKAKKRKKSKLKKRRYSRSPSLRSLTPPKKIKCESDGLKSKKTDKSTKKKYANENIKIESVENEKPLPIKSEVPSDTNILNSMDASRIPMPESPHGSKLVSTDLTLNQNQNQEPTNKQDSSTESDKNKGKIQIKNLKFSAVFEETVKKAEEQARKKAEKYEDGEYTDSSSSSVKEVELNPQFPKTSDPGGILKQQIVEDNKICEEEKKSQKKEKSEISNKKSHKDKSRSKRSPSKSRRSRSRSRSTSRRHRHRSTSRSRHRSRSKRRSRSRHRSRHYSPRQRSRRSGTSRSPTGVKLADSEKKRLLEVARRNAINMLKNGAVPAGAAALPPHTRNQVMAAIQSGGKSVDELTDFCKHLSKKEALGELSSVSSNDDDMSENEDTLAFHHPFLVKEKAPIVMNIRGGAPLPIKNSIVPVANKEELRLQFPVSSGTQHREKALEWVPVSPPKKDMQIAKLSPISENTLTKAILPSTVPTEDVAMTSSVPLALPAPPQPLVQPSYMKGFTSGTQLSSVPALAAPGPQAYPPGIEPAPIDMALIVSQKLSMIRKEQEESELLSTHGFGWSKDSALGQFTGSTGAQILTPKELASGTQAWAKKDQLQRAAPVEGGMGMHLLQKMGWTPGRGLGKEGTGTLQPLLLEVKLDTKGLQAKEEYNNKYSKAIKQHRIRSRGPAPLIGAGGKHPVSLLGEYCSKQKLGPPEYNLCFECGPDHKKNFLFKVRVAGVEYQPAVASANKKQAKADAAQLALQKLGIVC
ncbi:protein SON isoform X1 [Bombyx mandarina]|uniref:Protein SON isoform X1 n=1 Tax=Bombyx mandarina TaxID=7092 RepID=A0A6J2K105_BOMMA|nr:protein SON isoform X1 [Bombyx mandarina]